MYTYYPSGMLSDAFAGDSIANYRLNCNVLKDDTLAKQGFYQVPLNGSCNMSYGNPGMYVQAPKIEETLNQMKQYYNASCLNMGCQPSTYGQTFFYPGMTPPSASNVAASSSSTDTGSTGENRKFNRLYNLVNLLLKYEGISVTDADALNDAKKALSGKKEDATTGKQRSLTADEKFDILYAAYKNIDKEVVKEFLRESGVNVRFSDNKNSANVSQRLIDMGYEFSNIGADKCLNEFKTGIETLSGSDGTDSKAAGVIDQIKNGNLKILDFVSSWNNEFKGTEDSKRVIDHIAKYYDEIDDKELKSTAKSNILAPFVNKMIEEAGSAKNLLKDSSKKELEEAIDALRNALDETGIEASDSVSIDLSEAFDQVYLLTRMAKLEGFQNDAKSYYGEIDSDLFNDNLFEDETMEDLIAEGFTEEEIKYCNVKRTRTPEEIKEMEKAKEQRKQEKADEVKASGLYIATKLDGCTDSYIYTQVNKKLSGLDKNNIMDFLEGYYVNGEQAGATEGIIEKLDDECDGDTITKANKKQIIKSIVDLAKDKGMTDNPHYIALVELLDMHEVDKSRKNDNTFNTGGWTRLINGEDTWGMLGRLVVGGAWCIYDKVTDNEVIDEHLEALFNDIKNAQA